MSIGVIRNILRGGKKNPRVIYDNGQTDYTFQFKVLPRILNPAYYPTETKNNAFYFQSSSIYLHVEPNGNWGTRTFVTQQKVDLTKYSTMYLQMSVSFSKQSSYTVVGYGVTDDNVNSAYKVANKYDSVNTNTGQVTFSLDVSNLSGEFAPFIELGVSTDSTASVTIYKIWFA